MSSITVEVFDFAKKGVASTIFVSCDVDFKVFFCVGVVKNDELLWRGG